VNNNQNNLFVFNALSHQTAPFQRRLQQTGSISGNPLPDIRNLSRFRLAKSRTWKG
jgi:hypothetical protein